MHEKQLKLLATKSMATMLTVALFSFCVTKYNDTKVYASAENLNEQLSATLLADQQVKDDIPFYRNIVTGQQVDEIDSKYLILPKPSSKQIQVSIDENYMNRDIRVNIGLLEDESFTKQNLVSSQASLVDSDIVLSYEYAEDTNTYTAIYDMTLDHVYETTLYEDNDNLYIELKRPKEVYDKVIVVDAGHGGNDIGTASWNKEYNEKDINLDVVCYLKELLDQDSTYKVYYTRLEDEKVYLNPRLNLANDVEADLFLSVHCNGSEYISAKGTEVLYGSSKNREGDISSKRFALLCLKSLTDSLETKNRGILKKNDIYIIGNSKVPVALVELGFMSNDEDMKILKQSEYKKKAAQALYDAIVAASEEIDKTKGTEE